MRPLQPMPKKCCLHPCRICLSTGRPPPIKCGLQRSRCQNWKPKFSTLRTMPRILSNVTLTIFEPRYWHRRLRSVWPRRPLRYSTSRSRWPIWQIEKTGVGQKLITAMRLLFLADVIRWSKTHSKAKVGHRSSPMIQHWMTIRSGCSLGRIWHVNPLF